MSRTSRRYLAWAALGLLTGTDWVRGGGVVVVERSVRSPEPEWPETLQAVKHKRYGDTTLWYRRRI